MTSILLLFPTLIIDNLYCSTWQEGTMSRITAAQLHLLCHRANLRSYTLGAKGWARGQGRALYSQCQQPQHIPRILHNYQSLLLNGNLLVQRGAQPLGLPPVLLQWDKSGQMHANNKTKMCDLKVPYSVWRCKTLYENSA